MESYSMKLVFKARDDLLRWFHQLNTSSNEYSHFYKKIHFPWLRVIIYFCEWCCLLPHVARKLPRLLITHRFTNRRNPILRINPSVDPWFVFHQLLDHSDKWEFYLLVFTVESLCSLELMSRFINVDQVWRGMKLTMLKLVEKCYLICISTLMTSMGVTCQRKWRGCRPNKAPFHHA